MIDLKNLGKNLREIGHFLSQVYEEWEKDSPELLAAGLGYFMLFSLPPMLIIGSTVLGFLFWETSPILVIQKIEPLIGTEATQSIIGWLSIAAGQQSGKATLVSLLVLWLGASRVFSQLRSAMNIIWKVPATKARFWQGLLRQTLRKVVVVAGVALFFMVVFAVDTFMVVLHKLMGGTQSAWLVFLWQILSLLVSWVLLSGGVAAIYRYVPDTRIQWRDVWPGAAITAILLAVGKTLISVYLGFQAITSAYGAAGSVIVIMIWIYFAAQIFLFGAKLTWLYAQQYGSAANK